MVHIPESLAWKERVLVEAPSPNGFAAALLANLKS